MSLLQSVTHLNKVGKEESRGLPLGGLHVWQVPMLVDHRLPVPVVFYHSSSLWFHNGSKTKVKDIIKALRSSMKITMKYFYLLLHANFFKHDKPSLKPCCSLSKRLFTSREFETAIRIISISLTTTLVRITGR